MAVLAFEQNLEAFSKALKEKGYNDEACKKAYEKADETTLTKIMDAANETFKRQDVLEGLARAYAPDGRRLLEVTFLKLTKDRLEMKWKFAGEPEEFLEKGHDGEFLERLAEATGSSAEVTDIRRGSVDVFLTCTRNFMDPKMYHPAMLPAFFILGAGLMGALAVEYFVQNQYLKDVLNAGLIVGVVGSSIGYAVCAMQAAGVAGATAGPVGAAAGAAIGGTVGFFTGITVGLLGVPKAPKAPEAPQAPSVGACAGASMGACRASMGTREVARRG